MGSDQLETQSRKRWATVKIPVELRDLINSIAKRENKAAWQVIMDGVAFYYAQTKKPRIKEDASLLDKVSWYITKVATSVGVFKRDPSPENLEYIKKNLEQLKERLGIDGSYLLRACEAYMQYGDDDSRMEINAALKMLILDIILNKLVKEG